MSDGPDGFSTLPKCAPKPGMDHAPWGTAPRVAMADNLLLGDLSQPVGWGFPSVGLLCLECSVGSGDGFNKNRTGGNRGH